MEYKYVYKKVIEHLEKRYSDLIVKRDTSQNFTLYEKDEKPCIDEQGCHLYDHESFELLWEKRCDTKLYRCDVEEEVTGFLTYDRKIIKVDVDAIKQANDLLKY